MIWRFVCRFRGHDPVPKGEWMVGKGTHLGTKSWARDQVCSRCHRVLGFEWVTEDPTAPPVPRKGRGLRKTRRRGRSRRR